MTTAAGTDRPTSQQTRVSVRAEKLIKTYGSGRTEVTALRGVDLALPAGSFTAIMGPSGSGKSSLMHCLAGLDRPTSGRVFLGEEEITGRNDRDLTRVRRDRVGFVFQSFNLLPTLTARQNIELPAELAGRTTDAGWFDAVITSLGIADRLDHRPSELSGGQQQRVAIARALVGRPEAIFADEPTGALDSGTAASLLAFLRTCAHESGQTVVMVTHDPIAAGHADRALVLADGRIVETLEQPNTDDVLDALRRLESVGR